MSMDDMESFLLYRQTTEFEGKAKKRKKKPAKRYRIES